MDQASTTQSDRRGRRLHTSQLPAPSLLLADSSLYPTRTAEPLPTITTLNASSGRYPTRSTVSSAQKSLSIIEDELHSESDSQLANTKQESGEGGTTSDFVKKLYKMLEETEIVSIVSWGPKGDCFVVKDMNEFTKTVLPRVFKHSNFASFVRQLNKYDFHKVKTSDDSQFGEQSWTFRHPEFRADRPHSLENIKRKAAISRRPPTSPYVSSAPQGPTVEYTRTIESLQAQVDHLTRAHDDMAERLRSVETNYKEVLSEMVNFQRDLGQHDMLVQSLIQHFLQVDQTMVANRMTQHVLPNENTTSTSPFYPNTTSPFFPDQGGATLSVDDFMTDVSGGPLNIDTSKDGSSFSLRTMDALPRPDSVLTRLMTSASQKQEPTPSWSTTPRVLVVEDDQVSRNLCTKYVQGYGCSVDLAFDGASAVNKMNIEKFDLVFMDIPMPKLDGCSATSMIRQFNRATPIVAVTSNTKPSQVMSYFAAGMNDVLGKPFAKAEVVELLEKHLAHLRSTSTRTSSQNSIQYSTMDKSSGLSPNLPLKRPWEETAATVGGSVLEKRGRY
jgi:osomolarity two-component system response regulator SKN7